MVIVNTSKTSRRSVSPKSTDPIALIPTLTTLDAIVAFVVAYVTSANVVAIITAFRTAFGSSVRSRNVGRTTGWRIMHFQNVMTVKLFDAKPRPTVVQLVAILACEFPGAVGAIFAPMIPASGECNVVHAVSQYNGMINQINDGNHANAKPANPVSFDPGIDIARRRRRAVEPPTPVAPIAPVVSAPRLRKRA
jgi:hypothetical protein